MEAGGSGLRYFKRVVIPRSFDRGYDAEAVAQFLSIFGAFGVECYLAQCAYDHVNVGRG